MKTPLEMLGEVRIARPCPARWADMAGDDRERYCGLCGCTVYDISRLTAAEAVGLLEARGYDVCVRLYRGADGTVLTRDWPRARRGWAAWWPVWALASGLGRMLLGGCIPCNQGKPASPPPKTPNVAPAR